MSADRRITGWSALGGGLLSLVMVGLYFVYSGPPPASNVFTRNLLLLVTFTALLVFAVGLGQLLRDERGDAGLAGDVALAALRMYVTVTLVAASLEVGTTLQHPEGRLDPTVDGPLAAGMAFLHGPVARVLVATFLLGLACSPGARALFSRRILRIGVALALVNLALVPSVFFGMDAAHVYAANGWGSVASIGALNVIWFAVLGRAILRASVPTPSADRAPDPVPA